MEQRIKIQDAVFFQSWSEVQGIPASVITKNDKDTENLNGLIIKGYETRFANGTNENLERYAKGAMDKFIQRYFVDGKRNIPVDVEHYSDPDWLVGRIIYAESNEQGFYFVAYIPNNEGNRRYNDVKFRLQEGILQGFSKDGYVSKGELKKDANGNDYFYISEVDIVRMSLVSVPANGVNFESLKETKNTTTFVSVESEQPRDEFENMFN